MSETVTKTESGQTTTTGTPIKLKYFCDNQFVESKTDKYTDCFNPSTGEVSHLAPQCTPTEVEECIASAKAAYPAWSNTPPNKRVQVLFKLKTLLDEHLDELTEIVALSEGKKWDEAKGDVLKAIEVVEFACGVPELMKGDSIMNVSNGYDTVLYVESLGVFAGIAPWNFPAMIPMGWFAPLCIATGNTFVLKAATPVPQVVFRFAELWVEAGLPKGVLNIVTAGRDEAEIFLRHKDIVGVTFVGSTGVGKHIYKTAAANGKRVQALTEAKNHALVLADCKLDRTARGIINAYTGCAGHRCMALPVVVVEDSIADELVALLKKYSEDVKMGHSTDMTTDMGPVVTASQKKSVEGWIDKGVEEGATLVLDGRGATVGGLEGGYWVGPTIFDNVTEEMTVGSEEIFGPVLCIKRVKDFEEGINIMNASRFANGSAIYTQNGYYAREFAKRTDAGMVGVNVGIPVPVGMFGFTGHKDSFFGDLHAMGHDGVRFFTEQKNVTSTWFDETVPEEIGGKVDTWDGMLPDAEK
ncbi:MAG: CoA-acylating methylmalonate-semialdehyde dehydrogenase [Flavobacteriales bacterium]|nr:CoA-acylating methylmalonate-semialdehyde dehydrogenase [Flavobacteriales bacterium]